MKINPIKMQITKYLTAILLSCFLVAACGNDGDDTAEPTKECPLSAVLVKIDPTTSQGLFDVDYDDNGRIKSAGLQTYEFTYDGNGNVTNALLPANSGLNPQVEYVFSYNGNQISSISENWGEAPNIEERYVFTPTYGSNGYISNCSRTGFGTTVELNYNFDDNGNALLWTDPTFLDIHSYTFGTEKGLVKSLTHNQAFAFGLALAQPFFHFNNVVKSETIDDGIPQNISNSVFSQISFNDAGFQTTAIDPNNKQYVFEYECD